MSLKKDIIEAEFRTKGGSVVQREVGKISKEIATLTDKNKNLKLVKAKLEAEDKKYIAGTKKLTQAYKNVKTAIDKNNQALTVQNGKLALQSKKLKISEMSSTQLKKKISELRREIAPLSKELFPEKWASLNKQLVTAEKRLDNVAHGSKRTAKTMSGLKMVSVNLIPTVGIVGAIALVKELGSSLFSLKKEMQGEAVRSSVVLGDSYGYVADQADKMADKMGLTERKFIANSAAAADLLVPLGFERDMAADMAVKLQGLVGPLDEWTSGKLGATEVSNILTKAMLGENEQLKQLGIAIKMDSAEFRNLVKQKIADKGVTKAQAQAMAELELIMKKSADAQKAYLGGGNEVLRFEKGLTKEWQERKEAVINYFATKKSEKLVDEKNAVNNLAIELNDANLSEERRLEILNDLKILAPKVIKNIDAENLSYETLAKNLSEYNELMETKIILQREDELIESQDKKKQEALELVAKQKRTLIDTMREEISWFEKYRSEADAIMADETKTTSDKAEALRNLSFKESSIGNSALSSALRSYRTYRTQFYEANQALNKLVQEKKDLEQELMSGRPKDDGPIPEVEPVPKAPKMLNIEDDDESMAEADKIISEYLKANESQINEYLKAKKELLTIQKQFGLDKDGDQYAKALAQLEEHHKNKLISEKDYREAKQAITDAYKIMDLEADVLESETDQEKWDTQLDLAQERFDQEFAAAEGNRLKELQAQKKYDTTVKKLDSDRLRAKQEIGNAVAEVAMEGLSVLRKIVGEETALGKMLFLAEQAFAVGRIWFNTAIANSEAVAAFPITAGQPWVGINTASAIAGTASVLAQTVAGLEEGGYANVRRAQDNKEFRAKLDPRRRGFIDKTSLLVSEAGGEFVANAGAVQNPSIRPMLDVIDAAQKSGEISTLNLPSVLASMGYAAPGREKGGYSQNPHNDNSDTDTAAPQIIYQSDPESMAIMKRLSEVLEGGIETRFDYSKFKKKSKQFDNFDNKMKMTQSS